MKDDDESDSDYVSMGSEESSENEEEVMHLSLSVMKD